MSVCVIIRHTMGFRDDREALHAKGKALESEVALLRDELERTKRDLGVHEEKDVQDERELARLRKEVARLSGAVGAASAPSVVRRHNLVLGATVAVALLGGVMTAVLVASGGSEPPPVRASTSVVPESVPEPSDEASAAPPRDGLDIAVFGAIVVESSGPAPPVGEGCVLEADIGASLAVRGARLFCEKQVYDSTQRGGTEMTMRESALVEAEAAPGSGELVYALRYRDTGMRTGPRPQVVVDTQAGAVRVTRAPDVADPFTLVLRVESWSTPRPGPSLASEDEEVAPPPTRTPETSRCDLDGVWEGAERDADGPLPGLTLTPTGSRSTVLRQNGRVVRAESSQLGQAVDSPIGGRGAAEVELACTEGRATLQLTNMRNVRWEGRFGPGGATFLGRVVGGDEPATFWMRRRSPAAR